MLPRCEPRVASVNEQDTVGEPTPSHKELPHCSSVPIARRKTLQILFPIYKNDDTEVSSFFLWPLMRSATFFSATSSRCFMSFRLPHAQPCSRSLETVCTSPSDRNHPLISTLSSLPFFPLFRFSPHVCTRFRKLLQTTSPHHRVPSIGEYCRIEKESCF